MTINTTYESKSGAPASGKRYVKRGQHGLCYVWCQTSATDSRCDVKQGICDASDLPPEIKKICDGYQGMMYACEWPLED